MKRPVRPEERLPAKVGNERLHKLEEEHTMKCPKMVRRLTAFVSAAVLLAFTGPAKTHAATELGDFCWSVAGFIDTLRLNVTQADLTDAGLFQLLHGRWRAGGIYQIPVTGHVSGSDADPGQLAFAITGSLQTGGATQNEAIALHAVLDPTTLTGTANLVVASTTPPFRNTATIAPIPCDATNAPNTNGGATLLGAALGK
jgi:hypothetical protein